MQQISPPSGFIYTSNNQVISLLINEIHHIKDREKFLSYGKSGKDSLSESLSPNCPIQFYRSYEML